jgi:hypothetical protein
MFRWIAPALVVGLLAAAPVHAQPAAPAQQAEAKKSPFVFQSDGGDPAFHQADKGGFRVLSPS